MMPIRLAKESSACSSWRRRVLTGTLGVTCILSLVICFAPFPVSAQQASADSVRIKADPEDVGSIDAIMQALYDVISGQQGQERDWDRFRSLFVDGARLIPVGPNRQAGYRARVLGVEEFIVRARPYYIEKGFFEREISRRTDRYGEIVQVFSTYESRNRVDDPKPFARGINGVQLMNDGMRWWIVTIFWEGERADNPIPGEYLPPTSK